MNDSMNIKEGRSDVSIGVQKHEAASAPHEEARTFLKQLSEQESRLGDKLSDESIRDQIDSYLRDARVGKQTIDGMEGQRAVEALVATCLIMGGTSPRVAKVLLQELRKAQLH